MRCIAWAVTASSIELVVGASMGKLQVGISIN